MQTEPESGRLFRGRVLWWGELKMSILARNLEEHLFTDEMGS